MAGTRRIPIFMYHQVLTAAERDQSLHTNPAYTVTVDHFRQQMGCLAETGYRTLTLDAVLESDADLTKAVVITFDDGWEDNWSNALPVMKEFGVRSTVFVVSAFVGMPGYMTWGQLREMAAAGMAIQSHTATHRPLGELSDDEIRLELVTSKKTIEERVGLVVYYVSMPQGVYDHRVVTIAKESG
jgi:peptidoglycan/xylan/chitin deacetylase (PgdA/CDA1 family)